MAEDSNLPDFTFDRTQLVREDTFTDGRVGAIRRLVPVTPDGADDPDRSVRYEGQTSLMTPAGTLPLQFEIEADSLEAAIEGFADAAQQATERAIQELQEMRREQSSRLVVPGQEGGGQGGGFQGGGFR
ncbi:hypothetical protein PC39_09500 [Salinisphaera sp. PC39]|uniref:hypothetical protein n=1 Tax=Salinisphaera sp. PC39 TaxID=1304156 RepID=UPI00333EEA6E